MRWTESYRNRGFAVVDSNRDCLNANQINLLRKEVDLLILKILARLGRNSADVHVVVVEECGCVLEPIELNLKLQTKRQSSPTAVRKSFIDCPYEYTRFRAKSMNNSHCQSMLHRLLFEKMASIATEVLEIEETAARMSPIKNKAKLGNHYHEEIIMESSSSSPSGLGGGGGGGDDPPTPPASGCKSTSSNIPSTSNSDSDCKTFIHHVYLFNEQYIVKPPHNPHSASTSTSFPWHRDDMHQPTPSAASTISFWVPLDKTTPENGTLTFLPLDKTPSSVVDLVSLESHLASPAFSLNHLATINVPPGMIVVISPRVWHCSNANVTDKIRRCWMPQFSRGIVWNERVYNQLPRPLHDYFKGGEDRREELLCDLDLAGYGLLDDWLRMDPADVNCGTDHDLEDEDGDEVEEWGWLELNKEEMIEDDGCPLLALAV